MMAMLIASITLLHAQAIERHVHHYATHDAIELYLDRYQSSTPSAEPRPCIIFAFGGGFVRGARDVEFYNTFFTRMAKEGIVVLSIDYRLGLKELPEGLNIVGMIGALNNAVHIAIEDIYAATNFAIANAQEWNIDTSKIMLSGSSAGAIASLQAEWERCNGYEIAKVLPEGFRYAGVISCAGALFSTDGKPRYKDTPAPMLLFHGTSDSNVPYDSASVLGVGFYGSKYIARQLDKLESPYWFYSVEYADHSLAGTPLIDKCDIMLQFINDFVLRSEQLRIRTEVESIGGEKRPTRFTVKEYLSTNYAR